MLSIATAVVAQATCLASGASLPPPTDWVDWAFPWSAQAPGEMAADGLLLKPAGKEGFVVARDGHFYSGTHRVRFWGVSNAFEANFPSHQDADALARRLSRFGINAVRLHHMDLQPFPGGLFTDDKLETLSPAALDRLDYLIAALAKQGVWCDLNLHVSRFWSQAHHWPNADKLMSYDKDVDLFHPELIAADRKFAADLLGHVNAYTHHRYADEPSIAIIEINNENTLFTWGGEDELARMPEPYSTMLQKQWNQWLIDKYGSREKLATAWNAGSQPLGENLLKDPTLSKVGVENGPWEVEQHESARLSAMPASPGAVLKIAAVDGVHWHLQFNQSPLKLTKGAFYTVHFTAAAEQPTDITVSVSMAHEPWQNLGLASSAHLASEPKTFEFGFTASANDDRARLSLLVGQRPTTIHLSDISLRPGGRVGLRDEEDPTRGSVARGGLGRAETDARTFDWYNFLQATDERYFVSMRDYLRKDLGVKMAITGTIGLGPLGTLSQSKMDYVDAHAYWDHPQFPHRQWDSNDWRINNRAMVDSPADATLFELGAVRVAGKPFTCTEYNHAAPNEFAAETVPLIASYAALQDWDGVFFFAYSHDAHFQKPRIDGYFNIEGNPTKLPAMPLGARIFLGQSIAPASGLAVFAMPRQRMLELTHADFWSDRGFLRDAYTVDWQTLLGYRVALDFGAAQNKKSGAPDPRVRWTANGPGTGRYTFVDSHAAVFAGFTRGQPVDLGTIKLQDVSAPFATVIIVPDQPSETIGTAKRLLAWAAGRVQNQGMRWNDSRDSVGTAWGDGPPQFEPVRAKLSVSTSEPWHVFPLRPDGTRGKQLAVGNTVDLGTEPSLWYVMER